jgi:protoporphyrinogen oxidase
MSKKAIIIGAGPAGLTAAYELLQRTDIIPIILEKSGEIGGISKTVNYKGNRMDMGPHRFFSKSDRVMDWWLKMMPTEDKTKKEVKISYQNKSREFKASDGTATNPDKVMLVIQRLTRIYFLRKFFAYPIQLSLETLKTLGLAHTIKIMISFLWIRLFPRKPETSLEDFIINKFGRQLYLLFFKDYTEKVWGIAPSQISAEWGAQRIKGVSLGKAIVGAVKSLRRQKKGADDIAQKGTETSLIEQFLYPKYGPGSLWEEVAGKVREMGGEIYLHQDVQKIHIDEGKIHSVLTINSRTGQTGAWEGDYFFSTMPVQELIAGMGNNVPPAVREVAAGLQYRDFINVGLLLKRLSTKDGRVLKLKDNWIYVQEPDVKVGRIMIYNNWGGAMVENPDTVWIGMEYFCNKTDALWFEYDENIQRIAVAELEKMELGQPEDILDSTVQRMEKTYPAYFGTYDRFDTIKAFTDQFANLFLVGRNGMHKYNNADHSMLCAMVAVDNIVSGVTDKANLWSINTEQEYHEEKITPEVITQKNAPNPTLEPLGFLSGYLWNNKSNRIWWLAGLCVCIVSFAGFKSFYHYANYMPDSYSYLQAASSNADVNTWPVAYSKFLRLISVFTHSDTVLVAFQYLFLQASTFLFLFTLFYFMRPGAIVRILLLLFTILNPLPLYIANYISSDALFISLSLCWLTTLLWIIYHPQLWMLFIHALLLMACCTVRYNAVYYPLLSLSAFILTRWPWVYKLGGLALASMLVLASILYTTSKMEVTTGKRQFSAFGGWQLANNALYMYEHIPPSERVTVPRPMLRLDGMVKEHMDTLYKVKIKHQDSLTNFFYLWSEKGPLVQYLKRDYGKDSTTPYFKRWASEAPLYADYAGFLIHKYPGAFVKYFMLPNAAKFLVPPIEFLGTYNNGGHDSVEKIAKDWFNYKSERILAHGLPYRRTDATLWYPVFAALINLLFLLTLGGLVLMRPLRGSPYGLPQLVAFTIVLWVTNGAFSIFAAPIVLRYQVLATFVVCCTTLLCLEVIFKADASKTTHP